MLNCSPSLKRTDTDLVRSLLRITPGTSPPTPFENIPSGTARSPTLTAYLPLDQSSPEFANRLNEALHGREYARCVQNFQENNLGWFVDYLDKVRHHVTLPHWTLKLASRLSTVSILRVPLLGSACANSEAYARLIQRFQHPTQFLPTFSPLIPIRSPPVPSVRYIAGPLMAHRFASNVCERLLRMLSYLPLKCVIDTATLHMHIHPSIQRCSVKRP